MTPKQKAAHNRLLEKLETRTHELEPTKFRGLGRGSARSVIVQGKTYRSLYAAAKAVGVSRQTIGDWLGAGKAVYAE